MKVQFKAIRNRIYSPNSTDEDILVLLQKLIGTVNGFKHQGQHAGRGDFRR